MMTLAKFMKFRHEMADLFEQYEVSEIHLPEFISNVKALTKKMEKELI